MDIREMLTARFGLFVAIVICTFLIWARIWAVSEVADYSGHVDETHLYRGALRTLDGPDMHPQTFRYPSLPIYLTAAAIKIGMMFEKDYEPETGPLFLIPDYGGEPYEPVTIVRYSRIMFGLMGATLFLLVALIAGRMLGDDSWAWIATVVLAFSSLVQFQAVTYQNVDVPAAFFALLTLLVLLFGWNSNTVWLKALLPGVLSGLTVACKYNSGLILVSCVLAIYLAQETTARFKKTVLLGATAAGAFLLAVPYSILDFQHFYADVMYEIEHYRTGHPGVDGPAGLPQFLFYLKALYEEYGPIVCILSLVGITYGLKARPRKTIVVLAFPLLMLLHMSTNRVHFLRTVLPVFVLLPVFAAAGIAGLADAIGRLMKDNRWRRLAVSVYAAVLVTAVFLTSNPTIWADKNIEPDTRTKASAWILKNAPPGATLYIASDLWFAKGPLAPMTTVNLPPELPEREVRRILDSASKPSLLVLPEFALPRVPKNLRNRAEARDAFLGQHKERLRKANESVSQMLQQTGARLINKWDGRAAALSTTPGARCTATLRPYIAIYLIE